jgi:Fe2+ or Zn2+ uptake regulation protein
VVDRVWNGFKSRIELSDAFSPHHHHFTCVSCASTVGVESDEIETALQKLENSNGFSLTHHSIELRGFCENCK